MKEINIENIANTVLFFKEHGYNVSILKDGKVYGHKEPREEELLKEDSIKNYYINKMYIFGGFPKTKEKLIKDLTKLFK
jgi:hypothetical protein